MKQHASKIMDYKTINSTVLLDWAWELKATKPKQEQITVDIYSKNIFSQINSRNDKEGKGVTDLLYHISILCE